MFVLSRIPLPTRSLGFFNLPNISSCTIALGFIQFPREVATRKCFWGVKCDRCVRLTISPPSVSRLSRRYWILNISQSYVCPRPATAIAVLYHMYMMFVSHRKHAYVSSRPVIGIAFYMQMMFVPHRKHIYVSPRPVTATALFRNKGKERNKSEKL
jgi:hypothetical protein